MKKNFKTIMALTTALAISMSGMSMTSADEDLTPLRNRDVVGNSVTINGDSTTGEFDLVDPIPVTFGAEHLLSITIDFGDMLMSYDFTDTSAANNYGWGESFQNRNNELTITNNSTCPVGTTTELNIDTETYPFLKEFDFAFVYIDYYESNMVWDTKLNSVLMYPDNPNTYKHIGVYYLEPQNQNPTDMADMHNYQFNNAKIGQWTITLTPLFVTIPTETGYYVKVTRVPDPMSFLSVLTKNGYSEKEAFSIIHNTSNENPYYLGPYETEAKANSMKTQLDESSICSVIYIS